MTGNPQLTERQKILLRQAEKCRELASRLRVWTGYYDQNCLAGCVLPHMEKMKIKDNYHNELGFYNGWPLIGFTKDFDCKLIEKCAHDGTPTGAAAWLEQHALTLEAQV